MQSDSQTLELQRAGEVLRILAENNGNVSAASRECKARAVEPHSQPSIKRLREKHYELYEQLCGEAQWIVGQRQARALSRSADKSIEAQTRAVERLLDGKLDDVAPRDLATTARNLAQVGSISIEKAALLRGQPTEITETRDPQELLTMLERLGVIEADPASNLKAEDEPESPPSA